MVLCSAWKDDGNTVFSGGCDKQDKIWPLLSGGQPVTVAMHDGPIKEIAWMPEMNLLATGRIPCKPDHDRCYAMNVKYPLMVVGTADRNMVVFNLQNPQNEYKRIGGLYEDPRTRPFVEEFAADENKFFQAFAQAMQKLSLVGVHTGRKGEIRRRLTPN